MNINNDNAPPSPPAGALVLNSSYKIGTKPETIAATKKCIDLFERKAASILTKESMIMASPNS